MRATIDWSFRLLDRDEQRMFTWLSVFVDGFELDAACHVGAALDISQGESIDLVDSLVRRSMLSAAAPPPAAAVQRWQYGEVEAAIENVEQVVGSRLGRVVDHERR